MAAHTHTQAKLVAWAKAPLNLAIKPQVIILSEESFSLLLVSNF
jgi:hypothetical protein